jgi:hypothetical protein
MDSDEEVIEVTGTGSAKKTPTAARILTIPEAQKLLRQGSLEIVDNPSGKKVPTCGRNLAY